MILFKMAMIKGNKISYENQTALSGAINMKNRKT